jgi:hypothetical protein
MSLYSIIQERINEYIKLKAEKGDYISLNLSNLQIETIPKLPNYIRRINLSNNNITKIENLSESLEDLNLDNNDITKIENLPESLVYLYLNDNNITKIENLPESLMDLHLDNNKITKIENLLKNLNSVHMNLRLCLDNNKIRSIDYIPDNINLNIEIHLKENPLEYINMENLKKSKSNIYLLVENTLYAKMNLKPLYFKTFEFKGKQYRYHTISKGTLLFRRTSSVKKIKESFVGFKHGKNYVYPPTHSVFFSMYSEMGDFSDRPTYGNINTLYTLKEDINLLVQSINSINYNSYSDELIVDCDTLVKQSRCINKSIQKLYKIRGVYTDFYDPYIISSAYDDPNRAYTSQIINFYPFKKLQNKDIVVPVKDYNLKWLARHIKDYVMEPELILSESWETNDVIIKKMQTDKGYKHTDGITYRILEQKDGSLRLEKS